MALTTPAAQVAYRLQERPLARPGRPARPAPSARHWSYWVTVPFRVVIAVAAEAGMAALLVLTWIAFSGAVAAGLVLRPGDWRKLCVGHFVRQPRRSVAMLGWVAVRLVAPPGHPVGRAPMRLE